MAKKKYDFIPIEVMPTDIDTIRRYPLHIVSEWMNHHFANMYEQVVGRTKHFAATCPMDKIKDDARFSVDIRQFATTKFVSTTRSRLPIIALIPLFAAWSNQTCNELIFEVRKTIELLDVPKNFLLRYALLSDEQKTQTLALLNKYRENIGNPIYIVKKRAEELGHQQGVGLSSYLRPYFSYCENTRARQSFEMCNFQPEALLRDKTEYSANVVMLWLILIGYLHSDISADFFLVQDYSELATKDGQKLSPEEKEILSSFLCASKEGQWRAIQLLFWYKIEY